MWNPFRAFTHKYCTMCERHRRNEHFEIVYSEGKRMVERGELPADWNNFGISHSFKYCSTCRESLAKGIRPPVGQEEA